MDKNAKIAIAAVAAVAMIVILGPLLTDELRGWRDAPDAFERLDMQMEDLQRTTDRYRAIKSLRD